MRISHKLAGELHGKSQFSNSHRRALREIPASLEALTYWYYKTADWWMEARPQRNRFPGCCVEDQGVKGFPECLLRSWGSRAAWEPSRGARHAVTLGKVSLRISCLGHQLKGHKRFTEMSSCKENQYPWALTQLLKNYTFNNILTVLETHKFCPSNCLCCGSYKEAFRGRISTFTSAFLHFPRPLLFTTAMGSRPCQRDFGGTRTAHLLLLNAWSKAYWN